MESKVEERAMNTKKAYASDLGYIQQWAYTTFGNCSFPLTKDAVLHFITDHLHGMEIEKERQLMSLILRDGYKAKPGLHSLATVRRRLFALTAHHKELGYDDPCSDNAIKDLIYAMSRTKKKKIQQKAVTVDMFEKLLSVCDSSIKGIRDKAILQLAWSTCLRRSEITAAQVEHLTRKGEDFLLHVPSKKSCVLNIPISGRAAQALRDWLIAGAVRQEAIFRAVDKGGTVSGNRLSPIDVNRVVKKYCKAAGLNEKQFGAHSLRLGVLMQEATNFSSEAMNTTCCA
jgi:integrase